MFRLVCITLWSLVFGNFVSAQEVEYELLEETTTLRSGEGMELAEAYCGTCHSYDYIETQPGKMGSDFWLHEVEKMIGYGAVIEPEDAEAIAAYLAAHY